MSPWTHQRFQAKWASWWTRKTDVLDLIVGPGLLSGAKLKTDLRAFEQLGVRENEGRCETIIWAIIRYDSQQTHLKFLSIEVDQTCQNCLATEETAYDFLAICIKWRRPRRKIFVSTTLSRRSRRLSRNQISLCIRETGRLSEKVSTVM